jgi:hypothetical protein
MIRLVTVTGSRTNTLWHMLNHYKNIVDEMCIVVYEWEGFSTFDEVSKIVKQFPNAKIVNRAIKEKFNWEYVTQLYNETKLSHPNDWWIVSDDDEFHVYSKPVEQIILDCERNGWKLVRGGFVDRVGVGGTFPKITKGEDIFKQFPLAGFFRYQMSGACPNKVCIMKGDIEITPGQHYAKIDDQTTWKWQGWNHPLIAPIEEYSVQVHHFKWDSTCIERIKSVADIRQSYSFSDEYRKMYQSLRSNNFEVEIENEDYMFESDLIYPDFENYSQWSKLIKKIISI